MFQSFKTGQIYLNKNAYHMYSDVLSQKRLNVNFDFFELLTYSDYLLKSLFFDKKIKGKT